MGLLDFFKKKDLGIVEFENFNFKLAIIQELMYNQEELKPKFNALEFCEEQGLDFEEYGERYAYQVPPEIKTWFEQVEIPKDMARHVKSLYFDGGNEVYLEASPIWDGEDDLFDITEISESELSQFPNLKTIDGTVLLMTDDVKQFLKSKGLRFLIEK
ncbi:hypothetical protein PFZ59_02765 [Streptococcus suis]|uniref:DUF6892 domain-containing protein n=1 Tax=Streptococcus suis TaxID=1307 RepID=UPI001ABDC526|nr:hypothetical protein [Streptococcus suis]MBO4126612.1 hypothetical protein [Streptococcus suis]WFA76399.1 hypothetical protein PFZ59_02765 [Streptococcus suis]